MHKSTDASTFAIDSTDNVSHSSTLICNKKKLLLLVLLKINQQKILSGNEF